MIVFNFRHRIPWTWHSDTWISLIYRFVLADQATDNIRAIHSTFVAIFLNNVTASFSVQCTGQATDFFLSVDLCLILISIYPYAGCSTNNSTGIAVCSGNGSGLFIGIVGNLTMNCSTHNSTDIIFSLYRTCIGIRIHRKLLRNSSVLSISTYSTHIGSSCNTSGIITMVD